MEDKTKRKRVVEDVSLDVLLGVKPILKPKRKLGRLAQLNKHSRTIKRYHGQLEAQS